MATNEVGSMIESSDIVKNLEKFRKGCVMGDREYLIKDYASNLLLEEGDTMIRLIQGINKAMEEKETDDRGIAKGYTTLEDCKKRYKFKRYGRRTCRLGACIMETLLGDNHYFKSHYHEICIDDKLLRADQEQYLRDIQYIGDQCWCIVLENMIKYQDLTVTKANRYENRFMNNICALFLYSQHSHIMKRYWERKEEIMTILVHKCMKQQWDVLRQTAVVILLHLMLASKTSDEIDWLVVDCDFARKLVAFMSTVTFTGDGAAHAIDIIMLSFIAMVELGGEKSREKVKSLDINKTLHKLTRGRKSKDKKEVQTKALIDTYLSLSENKDSVKYFTQHSREERIAFRWNFKAVPVYCSNSDCARPQETYEKFKHCSRCMITYYCSKECQKEHWKVGKEGAYPHKEACFPVPKTPSDTSTKPSESDTSKASNSDAATSEAATTSSKTSASDTANNDGATDTTTESAASEAAAAATTE